MAARGISTLMVDTPGSGEALRLQGLTSRIDTEVWAAACVDYLETQPDVDSDRIRPGRLVSRWLLCAPRRRIREAAQARRRLGCQPQLGRGAAPPAAARGREPRPAPLGARALGLGPRRPRRIHQDVRRRASGRGG